MRAIAPGGLAVAADPVAGHREQERCDAERAEVRGVDQQPAAEAGAAPTIGPRSSATQMSVTSSRSGVPPRIVTPEKTDTWTIAATKTKRGRLQPVEVTGVGLAGRGRSRPRAREVDERLDLDLLVEVGVALADLVTAQIGMPRG